MSTGAASPPIDAPLEIQQILEQLRRDRTALSLGVAGGTSDLAIGRLETLAPGFVWLRLEGAPDAALLRDGIRLTVSAKVDGVTIRFELALRHAGAERDGTGLRLSCARPTQLVRVQRREAYRIRDTAGIPLGDLIRRIPGGERPDPLLDLSADGLAIALPAQETPEMGTVWRYCRLELPELPPVPCELRVCAIGIAPPEADDTNSSWRRVGCTFERPSPEAQRSIQAYVIAVQRRARRQRAAQVQTLMKGAPRSRATPACS
jgi:c-di-GMP-binding flagellar brake protein YcgR